MAPKVEMIVQHLNYKLGSQLGVAVWSADGSVALQSDVAATISMPPIPLIKEKVACYSGADTWDNPLPELPRLSVNTQ